MKKRILLFLLAFGFISFVHAGPAGEAHAFYFTAIDQPALHQDIRLQAEIDHIRSQHPAFVVINGIKAEDEPCTDSLYRERKSLFEESDKPLFLSLAGSDWIGCKSDDKGDIRIERLQRLRDILFEGDSSFGTAGIPLTRQSLSTRYTDFPENTYWQYGSVLFATLNLPADNNHYLSAAGRNNEFEERLVASRYWLKRIFTLANRNHLDGIVIFCDGNPFEYDTAPKTTLRDGFSEIRQLLTTLTSRFSGNVLIVHGKTMQSNHHITWKNNLGWIAAGSTWLEIGVTPNRKPLFSVEHPPAARKKTHQGVSTPGILPRG